MSKVVLFSPVGGTDPMSEKNCYDGALLHISRYYQPDKIYMYMSAEIVEKHNRDNRYIYCLEKLYEKLGQDFEYEIIERPELRKVQKFNYFFFEFKDILEAIRSEIGEEGTLLLNISSGTPAMKSALMVLATLGQLNCKTIQVSTPEGKMNEHAHDREDFHDLWELNPDNEEGASNRCEEVLCPALDIIQQENHIKKMLKSYDYAAAFEIGKGIPAKYTEGYIDLLQMAAGRVLLDFSEVDRVLVKNKLYELPIKSSDNRRLFEFALMLDIKLKKHEYADFIRAISPLITDLFKKILKTQLNIVVDKYVDKNGKWDSAKLKADKTGKEILAILDAAYALQGGFRFGPVYATHLKEIAEGKQAEADIIFLMQDLRKVEEKLRNSASHTMVSITEKTILDESGFTSEQIMKKIKKCFIYAGISVKSEQWKDYDKMNDIIIEQIEKAKH